MPEPSSIARQSEVGSRRSAPPTEPAPDGLAGTHRRARRKPVRGTLLIGLGLYCILLAIALPALVYPRATLLPEDPAIEAEATITDVSMLTADPAAPNGVRITTGATLKSKFIVTSAGVPAEDGSVLWQLTTEISRTDGTVIRTISDVVSLDRSTALPNNCCGDTFFSGDLGDTGVPVRHTGHVVFPQNVQKHGYDLWDVNIRGTKRATYVGTETKHGVEAYVFRSEVPLRTLSESVVPGALFGLSESTVQAEFQYADENTTWVEPRTGIVVATKERLTQQFAYEGNIAPVMTGTIRSEPLSADGRTTIRNLSLALYGVRVLAPWVLAPIGLVLCLIGWRSLRRRH